MEIINLTLRRHVRNLLQRLAFPLLETVGLSIRHCLQSAYMCSVVRGAAAQGINAHEGVGLLISGRIVPRFREILMPKRVCQRVQKGTS